jgi:hypothetical protein
MPTNPPREDSIPEFISSDIYNDPYDRGFYFDPNKGIRRFSIEVYGDFTDLKPTEKDQEEKPKRKKEKPKTTKDLIEYLEQHSYIFRAYHIVIQLNDENALFVDRGLRYKAYRNKTKFHNYIKTIPKKWLRVKAKKSWHIVLTIKTKSHKEITLDEAYSYISRYFEKIKKYLNKKYGVKGYIGVLEVHRSGYPHLHAIFFIKKPAKVFKWKGILRFKEKRQWEKELKAEERGYIDAFALSRGREEFIRYMSKYMAKQLGGGLVYNKDGSINLKAATLAILRIFRKHMIIASKSIKERAKKLEAEARAARAKAGSVEKCDIYIKASRITQHNTTHHTTQHNTLEAMLEARAAAASKARAVIVIGYAEIGLWDRSPRIN